MARTKQTEINERSKQAMSYLENGLPPKIIAKLMGVDIKTIYPYLHHRYKQFETMGLLDHTDEQPSWMDICRKAIKSKINMLVVLGYSENAISRMNFGFGEGEGAYYLSQSCVNKWKKDMEHYMPARIAIQTINTTLAGKNPVTGDNIPIPPGLYYATLLGLGSPSEKDRYFALCLPGAQKHYAYVSIPKLQSSCEVISLYCAD